MAFVGRGEAGTQVEFSALREMEHCVPSFDEAGEERIAIAVKQTAMVGLLGGVINGREAEQ